jgi:hypothetical protein
VSIFLIKPMSTVGAASRVERALIADHPDARVERLVAGAEALEGPLGLSCAADLGVRRAELYLLIEVPGGHEQAIAIAREYVDAVVWRVEDGRVSPYSLSWHGGWPAPSICTEYVRDDISLMPGWEERAVDRARREGVI